MTRKFYSSEVMEVESLPQWLKTGKAKKVAKDDNVTERLKKREREKQTGRNVKESERARRYEESMKKREKLIKKDKRRSEMTKIDTTASDGFITKRNRVDDGKQCRWQIGDGFRETVTRRKRDKTEKKAKKISDHGSLSSKKSGLNRKAIQTGVEKSIKDRTKEWVEISQKEKSSKEKCLVGRSWAWYSVPNDDWESETSAEMSTLEEADGNESRLRRKTQEEYELSVPWPICRFSLDDLYVSVKKPSTAPSMTEVTVHPVVTVSASTFTDNMTNASHTAMSRGEDPSIKKSFMSRVVSIFRRISRREGLKTV